MNEDETVACSTLDESFLRLRSAKLQESARIIFCLLLQLKSYLKLMLQNDFQARMTEDETVACSTLNESFLRLRSAKLQESARINFCLADFCSNKSLIGN